MAYGTPPNDIYHNGEWYSRSGAPAAYRALSLDSRAADLLAGYIGSISVSGNRAVYSGQPVDLVPLDPRVWETTYWVDVTNGNDSTGTGASRATAFKSIYKATQAGNTAAVPFNVAVLAGTYFRPNGFSNNGTAVTPTQSCAYRAIGGKVLSFNGDSLTWSADTGTTWKATRSNVQRVLDLTQTDTFGLYKDVANTPAADLATCRATPGSYFADATTIYVNRADGAQVTNSNTICLLKGTDSITATTSGSMHLYNIHQYGGNKGACYVAGNAYGRFYAEDCVFGSSSNATYIDNFQSLDYDLVVLNRCKSPRGQKDGFNFHTANSVIPKAVLFDCAGYENGIATASASNNGATMHDAGLMIDFNGLYYDNVGGDFAHANSGTLAIALCTEARGGLSDVARGGIVPAGVGFHSVSGAVIQKYSCLGMGTDLVAPAGGSITDL